MKLHWIFNRFMGPADDGAGGAAGNDRGDDFTPTGPDALGADDTAAVDAAAADAAAAALEAELAAKETPPAEDPPADADAETEAKPGKKSAPRIPLDRHEAILKKERDVRADLERQLAQYQNGQQVADINATLTAAETRLLALETDYAKLITDGQIEKSAQVMADIRRLEREVSESKSDMKIQAAVSIATEKARYNIALERVEGAYTTLNPDHADFDAELLTDVADLKVTYERKGMTPTAALQKAVEKLAKPTTAKQEAAVEVTPLVPKKDIAAERKKDAVEKTLTAVAATPPSTAKVGMDSDKAGGTIGAKDVMKMSYKDFSALPEEALARMRGDVL